MSQKQLDSVTKALSTYPGRDKAIRSLAFYLLLHAPGSVRQKELQALAKQLSGCRLVMRQFNHPSMIKACQMLLQTKKGDPIEYYAGAGVTIIYTVYGVAELIAWLADAGILALDAARWYRYCLYLWIGGLLSGIVRQLRIISRKSSSQISEDLISLTGLMADFIGAINSLPHKLLWAGKLSPRQSAFSFLVASVIGFYKCM